MKDQGGEIGGDGEPGRQQSGGQLQNQPHVQTTRVTRFWRGK